MEGLMIGRFAKEIFIHFELFLTIHGSCADIRAFPSEIKIRRVRVNVKNVINSLRYVDLCSYHGQKESIHFCTHIDVYEKNLCEFNFQFHSNSENMNITKRERMWFYF